MMWKWLQYVFGSPYPGSKQETIIPPEEKDELEELLEEIVKEKTQTHKPADYDFDRRVREAAKAHKLALEERERRRKRIEAETKLGPAVDLAIECLIKKCYDPYASGHILISEAHVGVHIDAFEAFAKHFLSLCKDRGITAKWDHPYIRVETKFFANYVDSLPAEPSQEKLETITTSAYR